MNDERYLCRGKTLDENSWEAEWVEGYYVCLNGKEHRIYTGYAETDCGDYYPDWYSVVSSTVGQYTGLKDKNGKRIFDGDVLRVCLDPEICTGYVAFDDRAGGFIIKFKDNKCVTFMDVYIGANKSGGKVWVQCIGNIHDNPELLEADNGKS